MNILISIHCTLPIEKNLYLMNLLCGDFERIEVSEDAVKADASPYLLSGELSPNCPMRVTSQKCALCALR